MSECAYKGALGRLTDRQDHEQGWLLIYSGAIKPPVRISHTPTPELKVQYSVVTVHPASCVACIVIVSASVRLLAAYFKEQCKCQFEVPNVHLQ